MVGFLGEITDFSDRYQIFQGHDPEFGDRGANDGPSFMTTQLGVNVSF